MLDLDDSDDLLGNNSMPIRQQNVNLLQTLFYYGGGFLVLTVLLAFAYYKAKELQEEKYRKAVRRKYGIPDSDRDPFNVAYARAQKERKNSNKTREVNLKESVQQPDAVTSAREQASGTSYARQRIIPSASNAADTTRNNTLPQSRSRLFSSYQDSSADIGQSNGYRYSQNNSQSEPRSRDFAPNVYNTGLNDQGDISHDVSAADIDPGYQDSSMDISVDSIPAPVEIRRGAKRQASPVEDIINNGSLSRKAGKRARRQSRKLQDIFDENQGNGVLMDIDRASVRGKKRDRTDAESTFGDDDSPNEYYRRSRRQKRTSVGSVDSTPIRGIKRSYEVESTLGSDDEQSTSGHSRVSSRKRGKRSSGDTPGSPTNRIVVNPLCGGRKPGEEWVTNGINYKVGSTGRRLRLALIKKRRSRFSMPKDSQHPDTQAQYMVVMETWLNDEDYKAAEERGDIFIPEKDSNNDDVKAQFRSGKNLFYSAPQKVEAQTVDNPAKKALLVNSIITNIGLDMDPFNNLKTGKSKRLSRTLESPRASPIESPIVRSSKSYSKWEKQDMEAAAISKLRRKIDDKVPSPGTKRVSFQLPVSSSSSTESNVITPADSSSGDNKTFGTTTTKPNGPFKPSTFTPVVSSVQPSPGIAIKDTTGQIKPSAPLFSIPNKEPSKVQTTSSSEKPVTSIASPFGIQSSSSGTANKPLFPFGPGSSAPATGSVTAATSTPAISTTGNQASEIAKPSAAASPFAKPAASGATAPSAGPIFSFGVKSAGQTNKPSTASSGFTPVSTNTSLTVPSPFGAVSKNAAVTPSGSNVPSAPASTTNPTATGSSTPTPSPFSFNAPKAATEPTAKQAESTTTGSSTTPKFSFGFGAKPATTPAPSLTQPGATIVEPPKATPAASPFTFGSTSTPQAPASTPAAPASSATTASATAPKFSFGAPATSAFKPAEPASSPFGKPSETPDSVNKTAAPVPSAFSAFGNKATTVTSSPFGNVTATPNSTQTSNMFGNTSGTSNAFGSTGNSSSPFAAPTQPASSSFAFGNTATPSMSTSTPSPFGASTLGSSTNPSSFSFGTPTATTTNVPSTPVKPPFGSTPNMGGGFVTPDNKLAAPKFTFGVTSSTPSAFGTPPAPQAAPTAGNTPSAFGSSTSGFSFGAKATSSPFGTAPTSSPSPFGATMTSSPFGAAAGSSPSPFGAAANTSSPFGATSTPFKFGQTSGDKK